MTPLNVTGPLDMLTGLNAITNGTFWPFFLVATFAIMLGTLKIGNDWSDSFAASSFFTGVMGTLLGVGGLVTNYVTVLSIVLSFIGAASLLWKRHNL